MKYSFYKLLSMFYIYSFLGWCIEVVYAACELGKFVNRGFFNGAICPIYGIGAIIILLCLDKVKDRFFLLYFVSVVISSLLELITGFTLDVFFDQKWWDYTDLPFNLGGYICLKFSLLWGVACIVLVKALHPAVMWLIKQVPKNAGIVLLCTFSLIFSADIVVTLLQASQGFSGTSQIEKIIHALSDMIGKFLYLCTMFLRKIGVRQNATACSLPHRGSLNLVRLSHCKSLRIY